MLKKQDFFKIGIKNVSTKANIIFLSILKKLQLRFHLKEYQCFDNKYNQPLLLRASKSDNRYSGEFRTGKSPGNLIFHPSPSFQSSGCRIQQLTASSTLKRYLHSMIEKLQLLSKMRIRDKRPLILYLA